MSVRGRAEAGSAAPADVPADGLAAALTAAARARPGAAATVLPSRRRGYRTTTYAQLDARSDALAAGLGAMGIGRGVRTALMVPPGEDFFALTFGLLKAGAVPVLIDPGIGARHLGTCLAEVRPAAFVGVPRAHAARVALRWCPTARLLVTVGPPAPVPGGRSLRSVERAGAALLPVRLPPAPAGAGDVAVIAFTSGSTGVPKGVEYRQEHFLAQIAMLRALYDIEPGEVGVATFPPFALFGPALGVTTVVPRMDPTRPADVDPREVVDAVNRFGATHMFGSPALLDTVGRWGERTGARMPSLRRVVSAGAPVTPAVQRRFLGMLGPDTQVHTPYGATEALPVTSIGSREVLALTEPGICVGRPAPGVDVAVMAIRDGVEPVLDDALRVPVGEVGEVVVRGPNVTTAYAERPAATALAKTRWDGRVAHRMGDLGSLDPLGRLWFCGRKAHRVVTADGTLFTTPCEVVFAAHPAVRRAALVGVGPPGRARPVIWVQPEPGVRPDDALTRELLELGAASPVTASIRTLLYRRDFPVDIRHNAKIDRELLAAEATRRLAGRAGALRRAPLRR